MGTLRIQLNQVVRRLRRTPLFTAVALITLAVGIGANTAIFSIVNAVLLNPLPYPDASRLVGIWETAPGLGFHEDLNASPSTYFTFREEGRSFEDIGIWQGDAVSVTGIGEPEHVPAVDVTDGVLPVLGVKPLRGRWFTRKDDSAGSPGTILLSYPYWQRRFGGDPGVLGKRLVIDGQAREVIGIMPKDFRFLDRKPDIIIPMQLDRGKAFVGNFSYQAVARLKPGVSMAQASADVGRMLPMMLDKFPMAPGISIEMFKQAKFGPSIHPLKQDVVGDVGKVLWILMATVGIVLFIACANVANLLLVRAEGRQQELAIRAALGAGWRQIAHELMLESVTLGVLGGALGLALAYAALRALVATGPADLPRLDEISIDPAVLGFTLAVSLAAGFLFGLIPVLKYAGPHLATTLREGGRSLSEGRERHRVRSALVIIQVALALVLLISSGLMIRTLRSLREVKPGFSSPQTLLTLRLYIPESQVKDPIAVVRMEEAIRDKIAGLPGVRAVSISNSVPMDGSNENDPVFPEDRPYAANQLPPLRRYKYVTPGYFHTLGTPLLAGRDMTWTDIYQKRPVVMVSESLAREYWRSPGGALGKRVRETNTGTWREIIGVVGDVRDNGADQKAPAMIYWPVLLDGFWGQPVQLQRSVVYAIRSDRTGSAGFLNEARKAIWSVNSNLPLADVQTQQEIFSHSMARTAFTLVMLAIAGGMALLLGLVGIYGVISYSVSQRTREIGIRMALGAQHRTVRRMFVKHGLTLTATGVGIGLLAAAGLMRLLRSLLFEVSPVDPLTYVAVPVVLALAALLASYLPARKATTIDPVDALRAE